MDYDGKEPPKPPVRGDNDDRGEAREEEQHLEREDWQAPDPSAMQTPDPSPAPLPKGEQADGERRKVKNLIVASTVVSVAAMILISMLLGAFGIVMSRMGAGRVDTLAERQLVDDREAHRMKSIAMLATVLGVFAVLASVAFILVFMPYYADFLQSGGLDASVSSGVTTNSTWG